MKKSFMLGIALAASALSSAAASAQSYPPSYADRGSYDQPAYGRPDDGGRFFDALRSVSLRDDQRRAIHDIVRDRDDDRHDVARRIVAILDDGQRHQLFDALRDGGGDPNGYQAGNDVGYGSEPWGGGGQFDGRYDNSGYGREGGTSGTVGYFNEFDLRLQDGSRVRLHQGTVIEPRGWTIRPGQRISVRGRYDRSGTLDADRIDVVFDRRGY